jgi:hypothetical protein
MKKIFFILVLFISFALSSCNEEPPIKPPPNPPEAKATLTLQDKSCTELWLKLELENFTLPVNVQLMKDNLLQIEINGLSSNNTTIYIDSLLPNKTYNFIAVVTAGEQEDTSNQLQATTLDTTSHIFSYQTYELGEPLTGNSSILYDVAVVDANNIWAVGEIYMLDSLGQPDPEPYAIANWDGTDWNLMKVYYHDYGTTQKFAGKLKTIYAFGPDSIYVCSSANLLKWKNGDWVEKAFFMISVPFNGQVNKMWGTSGDNLYFAGNSGAIYRYSGQSWQQITSGTELALIDIYSKDGNEIYVAGINVSEVKGVVLKGNTNGFSVMINSEIINESELFDKLYGDLATVWVDELGTVYAGGNLLYRHKNNEWNYVTSLPENFIGGNPGSYYRGALSSISTLSFNFV